MRYSSRMCIMIRLFFPVSLKTVVQKAMYFWFRLFGLSGIVILNRPEFSNGLRNADLKYSRWVIPINACISSLVLGIVQKAKSNVCRGSCSVTCSVTCAVTCAFSCTCKVSVK